MNSSNPFVAGLVAGMVLMFMLVTTWAIGHDQGVRECRAEQVSR